MVFPFDSLGNKVIDFNYPQDVSRQALDDLNAALKTGDGQQTVDALVRYSIAKSGISQDNMPGIINKIESTTPVLPAGATATIPSGKNLPI